MKHIHLSSFFVVNIGVLSTCLIALSTFATRASDCCPKKEKTETEKTGGLSIELISSVEAFQAAKPFKVGISLQHEDGFHTYWKNPGVVGMPTQVEWKLPEGFKISEMQWTYPELSDMAGHPCYGYERDTLLTFTVTPPQQLTKNSYTFSADAEWMCCAKKCYPGFKNFKLTLPVAKVETLNNQTLEIFNKATKEVPQKNPDLKAQLLSKVDADTIKLKLFSQSKAKFNIIRIFNSDGQHTPERENEAKIQADGSYICTFQRAEFSPKGKEQFPFILQTENGYFDLIAK